MSNYFFLPLLLFYFSVFSQNDKTDRADLNIKLYVDSTHFYNEEVKSGAYFTAENVLQIYPTEKVFVEAEVNKFGINSLKTVANNLNPDRTIVIEFYQEPKGNKHGSMKLKISNPLDKNLKYKVKSLGLNTDKWQNREVKAVAAKGNVTETFPDIILKVVMTDWELEL